MNNKVKKSLAIAACAVVISSSLGAVALAMMGDQAKDDALSTKTMPADVDSLISDMSLNGVRNAKDETVYVIADANGGVEKLIVSDWVKNRIGSKNLIDQSDLRNITNVKGEESYSVNADNMKVWDARGNDIYYRGDIKKELPVDLKLSYSLDGQNISAEKLAGKSGRVTIRFDYKNNQSQIVNIDGREEKIYVPFAMLTGVLLDNDKFTNIEVSNGRIINDGSRTAVVGLALPGMQHNLALDREKIELPEYVELSADVKDFELSMTATLASNDVFSGIDTSKLDSLDSLIASLGQMDDAMVQLVDGSSSLYGGICTLLDKSGQLVAGVDALANGAAQLKSGAATLDEGVATLQRGIAQLNDGLSQLASMNDKLNGGAEQVFNQLLTTATKQIHLIYKDMPDLTIENYDSILGSMIAKLDPENIYGKIHDEAVKQVNARRDQIIKEVTKVKRLQIRQEIFDRKRGEVLANLKDEAKNEILSELVVKLSDSKMTREEYDRQLQDGTLDPSFKAEVEKELGLRMSDQALLASLSIRADVRMADKDIRDSINAELDVKFSDPAVREDIAKRVDKEIERGIAAFMSSKLVELQMQLADAGAKKLVELKAGLDQYNQFYIGLQQYTDGVAIAADGAAQLYDGAGDLKAGTAELRAGVNLLYDGVMQLNGQTPMLVDGVSRLENGSMKLNDGLKLFKEQAIDKITNLSKGGIKRAITGFKASIDVSREYQSFAGKSDDMEGSVKFIYKTSDIKVEGK